MGLAVADDAKLEDLGDPLWRSLPPLEIARLALELGELRAIKVPDQAIGLLRLAANLTRPRNPLLFIQAKTLYALAHIHAGLVTPANVDDLSLAADYAVLQARFQSGQFPPWDEIVAADAPFSGPWRGWLERIRVATLGLPASRSVPGPKHQLSCMPGISALRRLPRHAREPVRSSGQRGAAQSDQAFGAGADSRSTSADARDHVRGWQAPGRRLVQLATTGLRAQPIAQTTG